MTIRATQKNKISEETFKALAEEILNEKTQQFLTLIHSNNFEEFTKNLPQTNLEAKKDIEALMKRLDSIESNKLDKILEILTK